MGKGEDEHGLDLSSLDAAQSTSHNAEPNGRCCFCIKVNHNISNTLNGLVKGRCVFALLFGVAVFLSAMFWLPFFHHGNAKDLDLNNQYPGHDIVASFMLKKPNSFLKEYSLQLKDDIFDEFRFSGTKVDIISLEPSESGLNLTKVVFAVDSNVKHEKISSALRSLIEGSFESVIIGQTSLSLTQSLFGEAFSFDVLKFRGGIAISPIQSAFLMQKVQILFNFTLNFSIDQILDNFDELRNQLKSGLHLASYENLYISLTNPKGSTINPPTIVQARVVLAVGIDPSTSRRKELANTINDSHAKNLGLNNTVFGKVKQVRLSSLPHSIDGEGPSPAPTPLPHHHHHHHHHSHHHHHHHHHHHNADQAPAISPSPSPRTSKRGSKPRQISPVYTPVPAPTPTSLNAKPPNSHFGYPRKRNNKYSHLAPVKSPVSAPHIAPSSNSPAPSMHHQSPITPLPHVVFAHAQPPSKSEITAEPPDVIKTPVSPSSSPSCAGKIVCSSMWVIMLLVLATLN